MWWSLPQRPASPQGESRKTNPSPAKIRKFSWRRPFLQTRNGPMTRRVNFSKHPLPRSRGLKRSLDGQVKPAVLSCQTEPAQVQKRLFRGCVIALLGIQPDFCLRRRSCEVNLKLAPFAVSTAIARIIAKNVLVAQFVADLGHSA